MWHIVARNGAYRFGGLAQQVSLLVFLQLSVFFPSFFLFHMTNSYTRVNAWGQRLRQAGLAALLLGGATVAAQAQTLTYTVGGTANTTTTYTDLGTTGTAIATTNTDDANSAVQPIGFSFSFNGTSFTQFVLNTNGFIKLGSTAPTAAAMYLDETANSAVVDPFESDTDPYIIAPFNIDLKAGTTAGTEYRVSTTGTPGSRVCTIQWKNVQDKANANATQYANMSFQVRLYEGTNVVELVYDAATPGTTPASRFSQVGVKGTGFSNGQLVQFAKGAAAAWSAATPANYYSVSSTGYLNTLNVASVATPDAGRTYRFTPSVAPANDIAIRGVYTLGKIATPSALPSPVRINIANLGTAAQTNVKITLNVTGANTFSTTATLASLAAGAGGTLTVANLPATMNPGTNTVTVSVPSDDDNTNNSASTAQLVTTDRLSYIDPSKATDGTFSGYSNSTTVFAVKYTVPATVALNEAVVSFGTAVNATTPYQVLVYDATGANGLPGKVLYTSATQNRPAAGGNVTVALPSVQLTGSFYIAVREAGTTGIGLATQTENPSRPTTFYFSADGSTGWVDMAVSYPRRVAIELGLAPAPTCAAPTALAVTSTTANSATISFTDAANVGSYQVIYGPTGFSPASGGTTVTATTSPFTITGLQAGTTYQVYVRTNCTGGGTSYLTGPVSFGTPCAAVTNIAAFPYAETFDNIASGQTLPCGITTADSNADGATWAITTENPNSGTNSMRYRGLVLTDVVANDWFFTPALTTVAGMRYQVAFRYRGYGLVNSTSAYTEKLEVKVGNAATAAAQTTTLYTNENIKNTSYAVADGGSTPVVATFTPGAGTRYVGFHVYSDKNQGNLYIDDLSITSAVVTATTSEALLKAVTVFPNPSTTGAFDLEIHGANAKGTLGVQVTNTLGQQVYTGTARDNYTNKLDLSGLAAGLYHLQVRNGEETLTRQIAIVK